MNTKEVRPVYELDPIERQKIANFIYIESPLLRNALNSIQECRESFKIQREPDSILIYGDRGTGKTSLIDKYIEKHGQKRLEDGSTQTPVFRCEVKGGSNVSQFYTSVLKGLGDPFPEKGHASHKGERLTRLLVDLKTELIIIDEFHELLNRFTKKVQTEVASQIKTLINESKIPIVLAGTMTAKYVLDNNEELSRRFLTSKQLPRFSIFSANDRNTFRKFLAEYDKALPFKKLSDLAADEMYERFFAATIGLPSGIGSIIRHASRAAIEDGSDNIQMKHLAPAFEKTLADKTPTNGKNPFEINISELRSLGVMDPDRTDEVIQNHNRMAHL